MPRIFSRKPYKNKVTALKAGMTVCSALIQFGIPQTTLVNNVEKSALIDNYMLSYKHSMVFLSEQENFFAEYLENCPKMFHGLTLANVRSLAYEIGIANKIKIPQIWHDKKICWKIMAFRFSNLPPAIVSSTESTISARATAFNPHNVNIFFDNLKTAISLLKTSLDKFTIWMRQAE